MYQELADELPGYTCRDPIACYVGELLIHELCRIGTARTNKMTVEPLFGDALELAEKVELRFLTGIAPFRIEQALGEVENERRGPHVAQMLQVHVHALADDPEIASDRRADEVGAEFKDGVVVEDG